MYIYIVYKIICNGICWSVFRYDKINLDYFKMMCVDNQDFLVDFDKKINI